MEGASLKTEDVVWGKERLSSEHEALPQQQQQHLSRDQQFKPILSISPIPPLIVIDILEFRAGASIPDNTCSFLLARYALHSSTMSILGRSSRLTTNLVLINRLKFLGASFEMSNDIE